jgi:hypothetical protein
MSKTRAQIQFKVLAILVGGDIGQNPSAEDADAINGYIDSEVAELGLDVTAYISDADDLDDGLFVTFCKLVANAAAEEFGGQSDEGKAQQLRNRVRVLTREKPGYGPQETTYF